VALVEELDWFDRLAADRGLDLAAAPLPATLAYRELLLRLDAAPYPDALGCLEVVERVYLEAWRWALPAHRRTPSSSSTGRRRASRRTSTGWPRRRARRAAGRGARGGRAAAGGGVLGDGVDA
jgi:hypothetical protein